VLGLNAWGKTQPTLRSFGHVEAPTIGEVAVAAQKYGVPASRTIVQAIGDA
jgi:hypothetical protein